MKKINIIVARDVNHVIGHGLRMPGWVIQDDFKENFVPKTKGNSIVMGYLTAQSLGKPLKNRTNIVLSRDSSRMPLTEGFMLVKDIREAINLAESSPGDTIWIIGGAQIYALAIKELPITEVHITEIRGSFPAEEKEEEIVFDFHPEKNGYALDPMRSEIFNRRERTDNDKGNSHDFTVEVWFKT